MWYDPENPLGLAKGEIEGERDESPRGNLALREYAMMGPTKRSFERLLASWADKPAPPTRELGTINTWSMRFLWQKRVKAWDQLNNERELAEFEERRKVDKLARIRLLEGARGQVTKALAKLDVEHVFWNDVFGALRLVAEQLRIEYGDNVARVDVTSGLQPVPTIREILVSLPLETTNVEEDALAPGG
jgi:hypothetical protein